MKRQSRCSTSHIKACILLLMVAGCSEPYGYVVIFLTPNLDPHLDIDTVSTQVSQVYSGSTPEIKSPTPATNLPWPWTIVAYSSGSPGDTITVEANLLLNWKDNNPRNTYGINVRTKEFTVPTSGVSSFNLPLNYLCGQRNNGEPVDDNCLQHNVQVVPYEDNSAHYNYYSTSCFDTIKCIEKRQYESNISWKKDKEDMEDKTDCSIQITSTTPTGDLERVNIALVPKHQVGYCGDLGCYIPLDSDDTHDTNIPSSDTGWPISEGSIRLPGLVCSQLKELDSSDEDENVFDFKDVIAAPINADEGCPAKTTSVHPCSAAASKLHDRREVLAAGLTEPVDFGIGGGKIFWTGKVTKPFVTKGAVMSIGNTRVNTPNTPAGSRVVTTISESPGRPWAINVSDDGKKAMWTVRKEPNKTCHLPAASSIDDCMNADVSGAIVSWREDESSCFLTSCANDPTDLTTDFDRLSFWTDINGSVQMMDAVEPSANEIQTANPEIQPAFPVMDKNYVCWTNLGTEGGLKCFHHSTRESVDPALPISFDTISATTLKSCKDDVGLLTGFGASKSKIYWLTLSTGLPFEIKVDNACTTTGTDVTNVFAIAANSCFVYWTNPIAGTIMRIHHRIDPKKEERSVGDCPRPSITDNYNKPEVFVSDQKFPTAIYVTNDAVYWLNRGDPDKQNGTLNRLAELCDACPLPKQSAQ